MILTVSQMMWCRDVDEILSGGGDVVENMRNFEKKNFTVRKNRYFIKYTIKYDN